MGLYGRVLEPLIGAFLEGVIQDLFGQLYALVPAQDGQQVLRGRTVLVVGVLRPPTGMALGVKPGPHHDEKGSVGCEGHITPVVVVGLEPELHGEGFSLRLRLECPFGLSPICGPDYPPDRVTVFTLPGGNRGRAE